MASVPQSRSPSASRRSVSSSSCSRTIFDPAGLSGRARRSRPRWGARLLGRPGAGCEGRRRACARASQRLATYRALERDVEDLEPLAELAEEDPEIAAELEEQVAAVETGWTTLEEQRLFSGRYDAGDALVTVNAGAGGTDAQDWADMVLRMEMRWAERRGFEVELLEVSPGEEAGIKSATLLVTGENAYGLYAAREGRASARAAVARSTPPTGARRASPGSRSRPSSKDRARSRSTTTTSRSTPTGPAAPVASTSTRPTRRSGSRTGRPGSSSSARTSARSPRTRRPRWRCCARSSSSSRSASGARRSRGRRARRRT